MPVNPRPSRVPSSKARSYAGRGPPTDCELDDQFHERSTVLAMTAIGWRFEAMGPKLAPGARQDARR